MDKSFTSIPKLVNMIHFFPSDGQTIYINPTQEGDDIVFYKQVASYAHGNTYRISSKSRRTSKSRRPRNVAASICQFVPINAALEISPHGKGSTAISVCARAFYVHTNRLIIEAVYARACRSLQTPPSNCRRTKRSLEIKSRRGEISRKYGIMVLTYDF